MAKYNILIVDDEAGILKTLERALRNDQYTIFTAGNTDDARPILEKEAIDLVICDYHLPKMKGIDFLEEVVKERPVTATVLLTGSSDFDVAIDALNRSVVNKFILKPWDNEELKAIIEGLLSHDINERLKGVKAEDIMSKFAITIDAESSLIKAAHLMMRFKISGMPVVTKSGKCEGIITATDLFRLMGEAVLHQETSVEKTLVKDVMTKDVQVVSKYSNLFELISITARNNIHTFPVAAEGKIVGIIGRRDVLYTYYKMFSKAGDTDI